MKYDIGLDIGVASTGLAVVNEEGKVLESVASLYKKQMQPVMLIEEILEMDRRTKRRKHTLN